MSICPRRWRTRSGAPWKSRWRHKCHIAEKNYIKSLLTWARGGDGHWVSVLTVYSDDPSSTPAEVYSFHSVNYVKGTKINKKRDRGPP